MAIDRSIRLDVSVPEMGPRTGDGPSTGGGRQGQPDPSARERFEQALSKPSAPETAPAADTPRPFALFGVGAAASVTPSAAAAADTPLAQRIDETLSRLMVDDSAGRRQVRMELQDDVLPGVTVALQEAEGRLQVDFICSVEASRLRLNAAAPAHAPELARRLGRDVLLRVQTDDEEDPCLFEVAASP